MRKALPSGTVHQDPIDIPRLLRLFSDMILLMVLEEMLVQDGIVPVAVTFETGHTIWFDGMVS